MLKHWTILAVLALALVGCGSEEGGTDDGPQVPAGPVEVELGEGFTVEDLVIDEGWVFVDDAFGGDADIEGMQAARADDGSAGEAKVYLEFWSGNEYVGKLTCMSGGTVGPGESAAMKCQTWSDSALLEGDEEYDSIRATAN